MRKLQLIMKAYRTRYQIMKERKANNDDNNDDDELLSEYAPSELSAIIAAEDKDDDDYSGSDGSDSRDSYMSEDEVKLTQSAEQMLLNDLDNKNIKYDLVMKGGKFILKILSYANNSSNYL